MSKLFHIIEDDLLSLERILPEIQDTHLIICADPLTRKNLDECKRILSDIRWNYSPKNVQQVNESDMEKDLNL